MNGWYLEQAVRTLDVNSAGKDFVIGDIHGCFDLLERGLKEVNFNVQQDRLFSVGDLVDRGSQSQLLLEWLGQPWFFACLGNHEAVLLDYMQKRNHDTATNWCRFGGAWFFALDPAQQEVVASSIRQYCSFAIQVCAANSEAVLGVVHADVPEGMSWQHFIGAVPVDKKTQHDCLWERERGLGLRSDQITGVRQVVCGHEIVKQAHTVGNVWLIDTGAYKHVSGEGVLSILEPSSGQIHTVC